jgi:hypothetical protein
VEPWWYTVRYFRGALLDGAVTTFPFLVSSWARMASSAIITLLMNSGNVPPVLSAMRSYSLVERPIMRKKRQEFISLKQGGRSVHDYSKQFNHLTQYAPDQVDTDEKKKASVKSGGCIAAKSL